MIKDFETVPVKFKLTTDNFKALSALCIYKLYIDYLVHADIACTFYIATHHVVINCIHHSESCML